MRDYSIDEEFSDEPGERFLLQTLAASPPWVEGWRGKVRPHLFWHYPEGLGEIAAGDSGYQTEGEFTEALERLSQLERKRQLARLQRTVWDSLFDPGQKWEQAVGKLEEGLRGLRGQPGQQGVCHEGVRLSEAVLGDAETRQRQRRESGKPVMGISTGLAQLDRLVNGWFTGLHVIAAGPGVGKTTLCLQFASEALRQGYPVLYVTYENAPRNLMLKLLCARAGISSAEIERGYGDLDKLAAAETEGRACWQRFRVLEGDGRLRTPAVERAMRNLLDEHGSAGGLIVFDYLQRGAHAIGYEQLRQNVSLLTGELRDIAMRLDCPLLAISSQNRSAGDYGRGGSGALDSLKESGDLEYGADTVTLMYPAADLKASPSARELELKVAKNRFGSVGVVSVIFRPDTGVFRERL